MMAESSGLPVRHVSPEDRQRLLASVALTTVVLWAAWSIPVARWQLDRIGYVPDHVRLNAAQDVVTQGWWSVIAVITALFIGSVVAVAVDFAHGGPSSRTAWRCATRSVGVLAAMWAVWIVSTLAAAGAPLL
ncbi:hypothetical protein HQO27_14455 [Rhodococcus fascians]|nr:hypothetical protein [Rhodococcus fascians]MBY4431970.1 hypothetical protein [Rhodococcus fascians]